MPFLQSKTELRGHGPMRLNCKHFKVTLITHKHGLQTNTLMQLLYSPCMTLEHSITARWNNLGVDFAEEGKPEYPKKNPRS